MKIVKNVKNVKNVKIVKTDKNGENMMSSTAYDLEADTKDSPLSRELASAGEGSGQGRQPKGIIR